MPLSGNGSIVSNGGAGGICAGWCDHDGRRTANTAVMNAATSPPCDSSIIQCWVERVAFISRAVRSNVPRATGAHRFTVTDSGSPVHSGCAMTARNMVAAVVPPNGPTNAK